MDFWKYNIGDEITARTAIYRIIDRNVWLNYDEETISAYQRDRMKYLLWDTKLATVSEMSEIEIDKLLEYPSTTIKTKIADTVNVTIKKEDNANMANGDAVNHPSHYQGKIEVIDFIEDKKLGFNLGNCIKYIARCHLKHRDNPVEDLKKARWYLDREIGNMEKERGISEIKENSKWMPNAECVIKKGK